MAKRIGIIGCGKIAVRHLEVLRRIQDVEIAGVTDIVRASADDKNRRYGVTVYDDADVLIRSGRPDLLAVLTPSGQHSRNVVELARHGIPIVVEKPIALNMKDGEDMINACRLSGATLYVVKQNRFNRPVQRLRAALDSGRLGRLVLGTVRVRWTRDQNYYDGADWRGTWRLDGGVLANQAAHHIDLLLWMMGPVASVSGMYFTQLVDIEADDTAVAILRFRSGAAGIIEATTATRPKDLEGSISILGETGSVEIAGFAMNELRHWNFTRPEPGDETIFATDGHNPEDNPGYGHHEFYKAILKDLDSQGGRSSSGIVGGEEAMKTVELVKAIYESARKKREIRLC